MSAEPVETPRESVSSLISLLASVHAHLAGALALLSQSEEDASGNQDFVWQMRQLLEHAESDFEPMHAAVWRITDGLPKEISKP